MLTLVFYIHLFLCIGAVISVDVDNSLGCPEPAAIEPCTCVFSAFYRLRCAKLYYVEDIYNAFVATTPTLTVDAFRLTDSHIPYFPADVLQDFAITHLYISGVFFEQLFRPSNGTNEVRHLVLRNVTVANGWQWSDFKPFGKLSTLIVYNTSVGGRLSKSFSEHISQFIRKVVFLNANISEVDRDAFSNLEFFDLMIARGGIKTVPSGLLPKSLRYLHLGSNKIHSLPDGLFDNMNEIKEVNLRRNEIGSLPESVFGSLLRRNATVKLQGNPLKCDCGMKWITSAVGQVNLYGKCYHPKRLYGKALYELEETDFPCSPQNASTVRT